MSTASDAAEQVVRFELEGVQMVAKLSGKAAKEIAILLISMLKNASSKTEGAVAMSNLLKSSNNQSVVEIQSKDLPAFAEEAKRYGIMYCVLKKKSQDAPVEIMFKTEDANKMQRVVDNIQLNKVDVAQVVTDVEREVREQERPTKSKNEIIMEEAVRDPMQSERNSQSNPTAAKTEKDPPSRHYSDNEPASPTTEGGRHTLTDEGVSAAEKRQPTVKEKLRQYANEIKQRKESERNEPEAQRANPQTQSQTVHQQPKTRPKEGKER